MSAISGLSVKQLKQQALALLQAGQIAEARKIYEGLSRDARRDPEIWHLLAACSCMQGEYALCEEFARKAIALLPSFAGAWSNLGNALHSQGKLAEAAAALREAIKHAPADAIAHGNLGSVYFEMKELHEAEHCYREALRHRPDFPGVLTNLGLVMQSRGELMQAVDLHRRALALDPQHADTLYNLSYVYMLLGETKATILLLEKYTQLRPADPRGWTLLGNTCARVQDPAIQSKALAHLRTAIRLDPGSLHTLNNLAEALQLTGNPEQAIIEYANILERSPGYPPSILGTVRTYDVIGELSRAEPMLRPWLSQAANTPEIALAYGIIAPHIGEHKPAIASLRSVLALGKCDQHTEKTACYLLGDLLDAIGEYDDAFHYYRRANALHPITYQPSRLTQHVYDLTDTFSAARVSKLPSASNRSSLPIFIVGMPRSGTTLVETILASHPQVHGAGELTHLDELKSSLSGLLGGKMPWPQCVELLDHVALDKFAAEHLDCLGRMANGKARVTDKMPNNFLLLGLIDMLFPNARVIHCMRSPIDTCLSIYCHAFADHHAYASDLTNLGHHYREYLRTMAHWRTVLRIPLFDLRYEDLVENPEEKVRQLLDFCELPWDEKCLRHHESGRIAKTFSYDQVRKPIYKTSVSRWKRYEKHLGPLIEALGDAGELGRQ
jgi:tetratricopeptide (TPR) repeat protein